ncbi:MAG: hypothetical protein AAF467_22755 [Actinomycetota bacterium]
MTIVEHIPEALTPSVDAALAWLNRRDGLRYRLAGLVEQPTDAPEPRNGPLDLDLVVCAGEQCRQERVRIEHCTDGVLLSAGPTPSHELPATFDPPQGTRTGWLERQLDQHAFVVLVFSRGFW